MTQPTVLDEPGALATLRARIPALWHQIYMNTGTSGPSPQEVSDAQSRWLTLLSRDGGGTPAIREPISKLMSDTRHAWARILGAAPEHIALTHNTSEGLALIAASIDWQPGDEVIVSELEHISGLLPWAQLRRTHGIKVRYVGAQDGHLDLAAVEAAFNSRTRLLCFSHVSYNTGAILPARELIKLATSRGALTLIDGAQSVGQLPLNLSELGCDFYAVPGQKWLMGPEGTGALYIRPDRLAQLRPPLLGWASSATGTVDFTGNRELLHPDARRFEVATPSFVALAGIEAAIRCVEALSMEAIWQRIRHLAHTCRKLLSSIPHVSVIGAHRPDDFSGLVSFFVDGFEAEAVAQHLFSQHRIVCRSIPHPQCVRVSLHAFNTEEEIEKLVQAVRDIPGSLRS